MNRQPPISINKRANWIGNRYKQLLNAFNDTETFDSIYNSTVQQLKTAYKATQQLTLPFREKVTRKPITIQTQLFA